MKIETLHDRAEYITLFGDLKRHLEHNRGRLSLSPDVANLIHLLCDYVYVLEERIKRLEENR